MGQSPVPQQSTHPSHEDLARYSAGALSRPRMRHVQQHVDSCPSCRQELREIAGIQALLQQAPEPHPPRDFALTQEKVRRRPRTLFYPLLRSATTAVATIVLVLLLTGLVDPALLDSAPTPRRAVESKPTPLNPATPLPVAVAPASTSRPRPTLHAAPASTVGPTGGLAGIAPGPAYPQPTAAGPHIQGTVARPAAAPAAATVGTAPTGALWDLIHLGALALLGLLAGLTWLAYRRERAYFV